MRARGGRTKGSPVKFRRTSRLGLHPKAKREVDRLAIKRRFFSGSGARAQLRAAREVFLRPAGRANAGPPLFGTRCFSTAERPDQSDLFPKGALPPSLLLRTTERSPGLHPDFSALESVGWPPQVANSTTGKQSSRRRLTSERLPAAFGTTLADRRISP